MMSDMGPNMGPPMQGFDGMGMDHGPPPPGPPSGGNFNDMFDDPHMEGNGPPGGFYPL